MTFFCMKFCKPNCCCIYWIIYLIRAEAEKIKITEGCVLTDLVGADEVISVPSVGGRPPRTISKSVMAQILQLRAEEICELFLGEIKNKKLMDMLPAGVVMTGGMSNFKGIESLVKLLPPICKTAV